MSRLWFNHRRGRDPGGERDPAGHMHRGGRVRAGPAGCCPSLRPSLCVTHGADLPSQPTGSSLEAGVLLGSENLPEGYAGSLLCQWQEPMQNGTSHAAWQEQPPAQARLCKMALIRPHSGASPLPTTFPGREVTMRKAHIPVAPALVSQAAAPRGWGEPQVAGRAGAGHSPGHRSCSPQLWGLRKQRDATGLRHAESPWVSVSAPTCQHAGAPVPLPRPWALLAQRPPGPQAMRYIKSKKY